MSLDLERLDLEQGLRDSLQRQVATPLPVRTDPWAQFTILERRHRRGRRLRRGAGVLASVAAVAAVAGGVIPLPGVVPAVTVNPAGSSSALQQGPTRGSLASDATWLAGLRQHVTGSADGDGHWKVVHRDRTEILFAGDVPGARAALVTVTLRLGLIQHQDTEWYQGPVGATPRQMVQSATGVEGDVATTLAGGDDADTTSRGGTHRGSGTPGGTGTTEGTGTDSGYLLAVGPAGSTVRTSLGVTYGADGRLHRNWQQAATGSGLAIVAVPPAVQANQVLIRATLNDRTIFDGPAESISWGYSPAQEPMATVQQALAAARGSTVEPAMAAEWVWEALSDAGLDPTTTALRIPWTGVVQGKSALLLQLTPRHGGSLFYAFHGDASSGRGDLRLLTPAAGASSRPILWRLRAENRDALTADVVVVTSSGTTRADLVIAGISTPITLDQSGSALVQVPVGTGASVRAYHNGTLIGETPLPTSETDSSGIPGDRPDTRLVN